MLQCHSYCLSLDEVEHGERAYSYQMTAQDSSSCLSLCRALLNMYGDLPPALRLEDTSRSHNEVTKHRSEAETLQM